MAVVLAVIAGWWVLDMTGFRRRWPWRIGDHVAHTSVIRHDGQRDGGLPDGGQPRRRKERSRPTDGQLLRSLPFTADLLLVALSSGHSIHSAISAVSRFDDGVAGRALADAWFGFINGSILVDELRDLPRSHGEMLRPLIGTLVMGLSSGAALEPALHRLADKQRLLVRRRTEERVRRLPILLLGPLAVFVLPSFVLLAIVPVILVTTRGAGL